MNDRKQSPDDPRAPKSSNIIHWFDPTTHRASEQVAFAVAHATGVEPTELPLIMDEIDSDALNALVRDAWDLPDFSLQASVAYDGLTATVDASGYVVVSDD